MNKQKSFHIYWGKLLHGRISHRFITALFLVLMLLSVYAILYDISRKFLVSAPIQSGVLIEGVVGTPISFNPLFATSPAEKDVISLMYNGLVKRTGFEKYSNELAKRWGVNKEKTEYTFHLYKDSRFHDGNTLTAEDFIYTVYTIKSAGTDESRKWSRFQVKSTDPYQVTIHSSQPFGENMALDLASTYIIPRHIWQKIRIEDMYKYNGPGAYIGSGPFKHKKIAVTLEGVVEMIALTPFDRYIDGKPHLDKVVFKFFKQPADLIEGLKTKRINSVIGFSPSDLESFISEDETKKIVQLKSSRVFGIFFNQRDGLLFSNPLIRSSLIESIDKSRIVDGALRGYAEIIDGPTHQEIQTSSPLLEIEDLQQTLEDFGWNVKEGDTIREKDGKKLNISLSIQGVEEFRSIGTSLSEDWGKVGAEVIVTEVPTHHSLLEFAREGKSFDALLFGYNLRNRQSLEAIWNSRIETSLSALLRYGNSEINDLFADFEKSVDKGEQKKIYNSIKEFLIRDEPAAFVYSPKILYLVPKTIYGIKEDKRMYQRSDRFLDIQNWYEKKEKVWKILIKKHNKVNDLQRQKS